MTVGLSVSHSVGQSKKIKKEESLVWDATFIARRNRRFTADSHILCCSPVALKANSYTHTHTHTHTMPFPCLYPAATLPLPFHSPTVPNAGMPFLDGRGQFTHTMPFPCRGIERSLSERHIRGMAGERHGMCESNTAALCKSNGKDTI
jgi:hypothetical protein